MNPTLCQIVIPLVVGAMVAGVANSPAFGLPLTQDGKTSARIYHKVDAGKLTVQGASELAAVLKKMSGAELPIIAVGSGKEIDGAHPAIVLGALAEEMGLKMEQSSLARDGFRFAAKGNNLLIVGEGDRGVYHGVCSFLETLGCGWFVPGPLGEVIPKNASVTVPDSLDHSEISDSIHREFWGDNDWALKNKGSLRVGNWRHAWASLVPKSLFATKPEVFALKNGQRTDKQLCTTNPETIRLAAEALLAMMDKAPDQTVFECGPNDGGSLCECANCRKLQTEGYIEPSSGIPCYTDVILQFANDLAEITSKKHPDKYLGFYIYSDYSRPPVKVTKVHPNVFPMVAPIRRCRLHGIGNPICPTNVTLEEEVKVWAKMTDKLGFYPYNFDLADSLLPWTKIDGYRRLGAEVQKLNIKLLAWSPESMESWAIYAPHLYLSTRIMWNSHIDVDKEMDRFYSGFYGEAAAPMKRYWTRLDETYSKADVHTGGLYGMHRIWTPELIQACRSDIEEAKKLATDERVKQVVTKAEAGLHDAELFAAIRKHITDCDFLAARKTQEELHQHIKANASDPKEKVGKAEWLTERYSWGYYLGAFGRLIANGAQIQEGGGKVLVKFPDVWSFKTDEKAQGVKENWFNPQLDASDWKTLATLSKNWDDQGLNYYSGDAWYRVKFQMPTISTMPAAPKSADLRLWFGGFDNNVDVYLNGQHLGELKGFMKPGEFKEIAQYLKPGVENVLVVRVSSGGLAELGTGGIMMPVMIYQAGKAPTTTTQPTEKGTGYEM